MVGEEKKLGLYLARIPTRTYSVLLQYVTLRNFSEFKIAEKVPRYEAKEKNQINVSIQERVPMPSIKSYQSR